MRTLTDANALLGRYGELRMDALRQRPTRTFTTPSLSWRGDLALPAALTATAILGTALTAAHEQHEATYWLTWSAALIGPAALILRRQHPVAVLWTTLLATLLTPTPGFAYLSLVVAVFAAVISAHREAAWLAVASGYLGALWLVPLAWGQPATSSIAALLLAAWLAALVIAAEAARIRRERVTHAQTASRLVAQRRVSEQRLQMAREVHDLIGHTISVINVQAGVGLDLIDTQPEHARAALAAIKQLSKESLDELRHTLGALRSGEEGAPRAPAAGLDRLPDLVSLTEAAGVQITTEVLGHPRVIPAAVDLAAYRIVQEALTNVVRHAGPTRAAVRLEYGERDLQIDVENDSARTPRNIHGSGSGISGMRERVSALGGDLDARPRACGAFGVHAVLPLACTR